MIAFFWRICASKYSRLLWRGTITSQSASNSSQCPSSDEVETDNNDSEDSDDQDSSEEESGDITIAGLPNTNTNGTMRGKGAGSC